MNIEASENSSIEKNQVGYLERDEPQRDVRKSLPPSLAGLTPGEYKKLTAKATAKMDLIIIPCLVVMYILNYLDRQNIAAAKLANIVEDLSLSAVQYQTCISLLFVGYILMQVPSNMILGKIKYPGLYICAAMALWGVVSACMGAVQGFGGLVAARFCIGVVEAVFFPGALFYMSLYYTRGQYAFRAAILYSGSQLGNAFGGLFAIAILKLDELFIIEGAATVGFALAFAFVLPNSPASMRWLTDQEKDVVWFNFEQDQGQLDRSDEVSAGEGFMMTVRDPKTWLMMATLYCIYTAAAVTNFFPSVVETLGYSRNTTYALTAPPYILCVIVMMCNGFHSDMKKERYFHIVIPITVTLISNIIAVSTLNIAGRYVAMMLMPASFYSGSTVLLSWITGSLAQPKIKRASAIALINAVCNTPNIWTSYLYFGKPRYLVAFLVNLVGAACAIALATLTRFYLRRQNAKLDKGLAGRRSGPTKAQVAAGFRYLL